MDVEVDEARGDHDAALVDPFGLTGVEPGHGLEDPVLDDDLAWPLAARGRVDEPRSGDLEVGHDGADLRPHRRQRAHAGRTPASRYSSAIRTATPFRTCSSISDWVPAATSGAISTPSFIGPGWRTTASGRARARRSRVNP